MKSKKRNPLRRKSLGGIIMGIILLFTLSYGIHVIIEIITTPLNTKLDMRAGPSIVLAIIGSVAFNFVSEWD